MDNHFSEIDQQVHAVATEAEEPEGAIAELVSIIARVGNLSVTDQDEINAVRDAMYEYLIKAIKRGLREAHRQANKAP